MPGRVSHGAARPGRACQAICVSAAMSRLIIHPAVSFSLSGVRDVRDNGLGLAPPLRFPHGYPGVSFITVCAGLCRVVGLPSARLKVPASMDTPGLRLHTARVTGFTG